MKIKNSRLHNKKSQSASEYLIVLAIIITIVSMLMGSAYNMLSSSESKKKSLQAQDLVDEIGKASELVYQEGEGAKTRVYVTIPNAIISYRKTGNMIFVNLTQTTTQPYVYPLNFPITMNLPNNSGSYWLNVSSNGTGVTIEYN